MNSSPLHNAFSSVSRKLCVPLTEVEQVYKSYWLFIKEHIASLPLRECSDDEFASMTTNFNIPYIGKLYVKRDKKHKYQNKLKYYKENVKGKRNQANRLSGISD